LLSNRKSFADSFHTFTLEWEPNVIRFYCDNTLYKTVTPADLPAGTSWVYDHAFFILLNVAVGGAWPGNPDATTSFPQEMRVDYVRVYQRDS
jgi:beta-glucanase (GH16 family)